MSTHKRLFLFAGYDKDGIIDDALIYYVSKLSKFGDIVLCMDSNCPKSEIDKIKKYTIHVIAKRHGEYDFGSYKRAFEYAHEKDLLKNYDSVYLVNDSVFGPMFDMQKIIQKTDDVPTDAMGIVVSKHKTHSFMESWFVRLNKKIFMSKWFYDFITNVQTEQYKHIITIKYEHGLTNLVKNNGCSWDGIYKVYGRFTYNNPRRLFNRGCPFLKKLSFTRHNGACGNQIKYILKHSDKSAVKSIMTTANRIYGEKYMQSFLTYNPIKILARETRYAIQKIKSGQI
ncbi:MAG: lipopolysaccharide biosynthesis-like protein [Alphaproteobacteria bacterium]|nr:lipopolysaccharide biosynthesis-like protein [Alphaproteobacteria bacterium]